MARISLKNMYIRLLALIEGMGLVETMIEGDKSKPEVFATPLKLSIKGMGLNELEKLERGPEESSI